MNFVGKQYECGKENIIILNSFRIHPGPAGSAYDVYDMVHIQKNGAFFIQRHTKDMVDYQIITNKMKYISRVDESIIAKYLLLKGS